jgi:hypothetical protein
VAHHVDPNTITSAVEAINGTKDVIIPTGVSLVGAAADAIFSYALQKQYFRWESKTKERDARRALDGALHSAYQQFQSRFPAFSQSLFDETFLEGRARGILARCLSRADQPSASELATAYVDYLNLTGPTRAERKAEIEPAADFFLGRFIEGLRADPIFRELLDSQSLDKTAANTSLIAERLSSIEEEIRKTNDPRVSREDLLTSLADANQSLSTQSNAIAGVHIPRPEVDEILDWLLRADDDERVGVLLDQPGAGKTAVMRDVLEQLKDRQIPALALKADNVSGIKTYDDLLGLLYMECSIEDATRYLIEEEGSFVLLVDQIDALSFVLTRDQTALNIVLGRIESIRKMPGARVLFSCRTFDLKNDPLLSKITTDHSFTLQPLPEEGIKAVLATLENSDPTQLLASHRELLMSPLNLGIYMKVAQAGDDAERLEPYFDLQELYEALWRLRIDAAPSALLVGGGENDRPDVAIYKTVDAMIGQKSVSVPHSVLDNYRLSKLYLFSTGIIQEEGRNIRFIHHTFFDYAYARRFVAQGVSLCATVLEGPQGLFERSMVIQVLAYLRGTNQLRYIQELRCLVTAKDLKFHLLDHILSWLGAQTRTSILDEELTLAQTLLDNINTAPLLLYLIRENGKWFDRLHEAGTIERMLQSRNEHMATLASNFLSTLIQPSIPAQARTPEVLNLLTPYLNTSDNWDYRILQSLERMKDWSSEQAIDMACRLIKRGEIINAFNLGFHAMAVSNPAGGCRAVRAYLDVWLDHERKTAADEESAEAREQTMRRKYSFDGAATLPYGVDEIVMAAANNHPAELVEQLFPWLIEAVSSLKTTHHPHVFSSDNMFFMWWPDRTPEDSRDLDVLLQALLIALRKLDIEDPDTARAYIEQLSPIDNESVQLLIAYVYLADPERHAEDIAAFLLSDVRRLYLGVAQTSFYVSRRLAASAFPHLSPSRREALETAIHEFDISFWKEHSEYEGRTEIGFLLALPHDLLTSDGRSRLVTLKDKFPDYKLEEPHRVVMKKVESPIPAATINNMNDDDWLAAMRKYGDDTEHFNRYKPGMGGVSELSGDFADAVEKDPERFLKLSERFEPDISAHYVVSLILGLGRDSTPIELFFEAVRRFADSIPARYRGAVCQAIRSKAEKKVQIPDDILSMMEEWSFTESELTEQLPADEGTIPITDRSRVLDAYLACLYAITPPPMRRILDVLERASTDNTSAVRDIVLEWLLYVVESDHERSLAIFEQTLDGYAELLASPAAFEMIRYSRWKHFEKIRPFIELMMESTNDKVREEGAILACLSAFTHPEARDLVDRALAGDASLRKGAAAVYAHNAGNAELWAECEIGLRLLMNDEDEGVRLTIGSCFAYMRPEQVNRVRQFILDFLPSQSLREGASQLAAYVDKVAGYEQDLALRVAQVVLDTAEAAQNENNMPSSGRRFSHMLADKEFVRLPITVYMNAPDDKVRKEAMELFDRLLKMGSYEARQTLGHWDRR